MGRAKDRMMQEEEQGWSFSDKRICSRCISDKHLKSYVTENCFDDDACSFCERSPSADLDDVLTIIGNTVADYYNRAVEEAPWDGAEGGYQGVTYDTSEVVEHIVGGVSRRDDVMDAITESFADDIWVERNMFSLNGEQMYVASWDEFCEAARREAEYGDDDNPQEQDPDVIHVSEMLDALQEIVQSANLIRTLPADVPIHRVRVHKRDDVCATSETLGPPPTKAAPTNRMSKAGVSVFYGALERATAALEASVSMPVDQDLVLTAAAWSSSRPLNVLDLTALPPVPNIFAVSRDERGANMFLRHFVRSISAPVRHDGRQHIEYVPTQILTNHFRNNVTAPDGSALDGIVYPSARRRGGKSLVMFCSKDDLDPEQLDGRAPLLTIDLNSVTRIRRPGQRR